MLHLLSAPPIAQRLSIRRRCQSLEATTRRLDDSTATLSALSSLSDLSHSPDWGLAIVRDSELCHQLLSHISGLLSESSPASHRSEAVRVLSTAIQSSSDALAALLSHFPDRTGKEVDEPRADPLEAVVTVLAAYSILRDKSPDSKLTARAIGLLSQLCVDETQSARFIGPSFILRYWGEPKGTGLDRLFWLSIVASTKSRSSFEPDADASKVTAQAAKFVAEYAEKSAPSTPCVEMTEGWGRVAEAFNGWCDIRPPWIEDEDVVASLREARVPKQIKSVRTSLGLARILTLVL